MDILEELLSLGGLGIQYCIKSERAYSKLHECPDGLLAVDHAEFNNKYTQEYMWKYMVEHIANTISGFYIVLEPSKENLKDILAFEKYIFSKKFKKRLYKRGVLVYNQPRRTVLVHNFYQKRYLNGTRKEQYTP